MDDIILESAGVRQQRGWCWQLAHDGQHRMGIGPLHSPTGSMLGRSQTRSHETKTCWETLRKRDVSCAPLGTCFSPVLYRQWPEL
jgi:hypothetical protein